MVVYTVLTVSNHRVKTLRNKLQAELRKVKKEAWRKVGELLTDEQRKSMGKGKAWRKAYGRHDDN